MDEMTLLIEIIVMVGLFIFWAVAIRRIWHLHRFYRGLKRATPASSESKKGDYVDFNGVLTLPKMETPLCKQSCSYWGLIINAEFQTKEKKPGKGMQTHYPVIYKAESDNLPLLLADQSQIVHVVMDKPMHFMANMKSKTTKHSSVPINEAKPFDKTKYSSYESHEYWLPEKAVMHLWATVTETNNSCISVSSGNDPKLPTLLYYGEKISLYRKFLRRFTILFCLIIGSPLIAYWFLTTDQLAFDQVYFAIAEVLTLLMVVVLYRIGRITFVR